MAWNGSGTFSRTNGDNTGSTTWQQDKADGDKITASRHDTHDQDLADGINACLAKNGENAMTGNLDMGGQDITNIDEIQGTVTFTDGVTFTNAVSIVNDTSLTIFNSAFDTKLSVDIDSVNIGANTSFTLPSNAPASASASGTSGTVTWDANYIYICTATNTWKRVAIATW